MADEILTVLEVALLLKVAERDGLHNGAQVRASLLKVRGQWRFRRKSLDAWMVSQVNNQSACDQSATKP